MCLTCTQQQNYCVEDQMHQILFYDSTAYEIFFDIQQRKIVQTNFIRGISYELQMSVTIIMTVFIFDSLDMIFLLLFLLLVGGIYIRTLITSFIKQLDDFFSFLVDLQALYKVTIQSLSLLVVKIDDVFPLYREVYLVLF